jgi:transaldolase/glucose-6-phosphate isomerase
VRGATVKENLDEADAALARLQQLGIDLEAVGKKLQDNGVDAFAASFDELMATLEKKRISMVAVEVNRQELRLGKYQKRVARRLQTWQADHFSSRLWKKDPTLWSAEPVAELTDRLGWLTLPESMKNQAADLRAFADRVKADGFRHVLLLGMGGSSLAPEVFQHTFGNPTGYPELMVLDSTHPAAVRSVGNKVDLSRTLFLVSSKSGTTTETSSFFYYFWQKLSQLKDQPGEHFVAITDPGTPLEKLASERSFRAIFKAPDDVGGRYSALTVFGLVPAALIGVDIEMLLDRARRMSQASSSSVRESDSPPLVLGAALAELTLAKRDKVTFVASPALAAFPSWVEQLIAESTGKERKGIVPVVNEPAAAAEKYGADRCFIYVSLKGEESKELEQNVATLASAGHPIVRIELSEKIDLGQEFFRWEVAVAAAGAALGIHPFNQPDVQLAKDLAKKAMDKKTDGGKKKPERKDEVPTTDQTALQQAVSSWLGKKKARDYLVVQAYLNPTAQHTAALQSIRLSLRDRLSLATTLGYGPRFLHSTGQLHKGGPN